jgi:two-component sensor histidine kinase
MVLHELATNAAKYGSLSSTAGLVDLSWSVEQGATGPELAIEWQESGGPAVGKPERIGFGTRLMERAITRELGGTAHMEFDPAGVRAHIGFPLASISGA